MLFLVSASRWRAFAGNWSSWDPNIRVTTVCVFTLHIGGDLKLFVASHCFNTHTFTLWEIYMCFCHCFITAESYWWGCVWVTVSLVSEVQTTSQPTFVPTKQLVLCLYFLSFFLLLLSIYLSLCLSIIISLCHSVFCLVCLSLYHYVVLSVVLSICVSLCLAFCHSVCLYIHFFLISSICLSFSFHLSSIFHLVI